MRQIRKNVHHGGPAVAEALRTVDVDRIAATYRDQGHFVRVDDMLSDALFEKILGESRSMHSRVHWQHFPRIRKGGVIGYRALQKHAPTIVELYRSPEFVDLLSRIVGRALLLKSDRDEHACAIYWYGRRGDHVRPHFDSCGCDDDASFTILCGLIDQCSNHLEYQLKGEDGQLGPVQRIAIEPGSMVIFNGSRVFHSVTPLGANENRAVLSLSYATQATMSRWDRWQENVKDAFLYFGLPGLLQRNYSEVLRPPRRHTDDRRLHVVITGSSSGIGAAIAREYGRRGARLALFARRRERLEEVAEECKSLGAADALVLPGDATVPADVEAAVAELLRSWTHIDRAYLNVGGSVAEVRPGTAFVECCTSDLQTAGHFSAAMAEDIMKLNYFSALYWVEPMLAKMRAQRSGTIAITGSMAADGGLPRSSAYTASKMAVRALVDGLRYDAAKMGIHICRIEPGFVESDQTEGYGWLPFLKSTDTAGADIVRSVEAGRAVIRYPREASLLIRLGSAMPLAVRGRVADLLTRLGHDCDD